MVTRTEDVEAVFGGIRAREGRIKSRSTGRTVTPTPTPHAEDVWQTYTEGKPLQYTVPAWAVSEMRLRLGRTVRYLNWKHPDELERHGAPHFKLTMRIETEAGELIGDGQPQRNSDLAELPRDTLVFFNFQMHLPLNRGRRAGERKSQPAKRRTKRRRALGFAHAWRTMADVRHLIKLAAPSGGSLGGALWPR